MNRSLPVYINILHDARDIDTERGQPIKGVSLVMALYNHMQEMGVVYYGVRTCEDKTEADKTFINIKEHFKITWWRYRNDQKTTKAAGFYSVNAELVEETAEAVAEFANKAV